MKRPSPQTSNNPAAAGSHHTDFREKCLSVQGRDSHTAEVQEDQEMSVHSFISFALSLMICLHLSQKESEWSTEDSAISFLVCERSSKTERKNTSKKYERT